MTQTLRLPLFNRGAQWYWTSDARSLDNLALLYIKLHAKQHWTAVYIQHFSLFSGSPPPLPVCPAYPYVSSYLYCQEKRRISIRRIQTEAPEWLWSVSDIFLSAPWFSVTVEYESWRAGRISTVSRISSRLNTGFVGRLLCVKNKNKNKNTDPNPGFCCSVVGA